MNSDLYQIVNELSAYSVQQLEEMFALKKSGGETIAEFVERCALIELEHFFK